MTYREFLKQNETTATNAHKEAMAIQKLIMEYLNFTPTEWYFNLDKEINDIDSLQKIVDKYLIDNIPIQYILGYTYFYGLKFYVDQNVLIPRNDTEVLVEEVLKYIGEKTCKVVDIGVGSGCIAITLKKYSPQIAIIGVDISQEAIDIAKKNAIFNSVDIDFRVSDLLENVNEKIDIIVSNPPYISSNDYVEKIVKDNEPHIALFALEDGMFYYKQILKQSLTKLSFYGMIFFEIGYNQKDKIISLIKEYYPNSKIKVVKDLNNIDRVVIVYCNQ